MAPAEPTFRQSHSSPRPIATLADMDALSWLDTLVCFPERLFFHANKSYTQKIPARCVTTRHMDWNYSRNATGCLQGLTVTACSASVEYIPRANAPDWDSRR